MGGGDETVSSVVDALAGTGVALGLLPLGTANDLARTLGIPLVRLEHLLQLVATDHPMAVNVDGEIIATTPVSFSVSANALDVIVPQGSTAARRDREAAARR